MTKAKKHVVDSHDFVMCSSDVNNQPVGGRVADKHRQLHADSVPPPRLPACDEDYVATIYSGSQHATHRVEPSWKVIQTTTRGGSTRKFMWGWAGPWKVSTVELRKIQLHNCIAEPKQSLHEENVIIPVSVATWGGVGWEKTGAPSAPA